MTARSRQTTKKHTPGSRTYGLSFGELIVNSCTELPVPSTHTSPARIPDQLVSIVLSKCQSPKKKKRGDELRAPISLPVWLAVRLLQGRAAAGRRSNCRNHATCRVRGVTNHTRLVRTEHTVAGNVIRQGRACGRVGVDHTVGPSRTRRVRKCITALGGRIGAAKHVVNDSCSARADPTRVHLHQRGGIAVRWAGRCIGDFTRVDRA